MKIVLTATDRNGHRVAQREVITGSYSGRRTEREAIYAEFAQMRPDGFPPYVFVDILGTQEGYLVG